MSETKKILLIDDDVDFTESNRDLLEAFGYDVVIAHDGTAGLEKARTEKPDLLILDVMMTTDTEGFDVARKIAETPELKHMKVIMVTGITKEMKLPFGIEPDENWLPVERVMEKPIDPDRLLKQVEKSLQD